MCEKHDRAITSLFCSADSLLTSMFSCPKKRSVKRKVKFGEKLFQTKLLSRLSHKVYRLLCSHVLLRYFTIE